MEITVIQELCADPNSGPWPNGQALCVDRERSPWKTGWLRLKGRKVRAQFQGSAARDSVWVRTA